VAVCRRRHEIIAALVVLFAFPLLLVNELGKLLDGVRVCCLLINILEHGEEMRIPVVLVIKLSQSPRCWVPIMPQGLFHRRVNYLTRHRFAILGGPG
jgi:hypothetical protein